jgi:Uma2 family endonuclease
MNWLNSLPPGPIAADPEDALYPDSDGKPIADNTLQYEWIVTIKGNFDVLFADREDVFVAGDLLWYPVRGDPKTRTAPDALVAFGRPKGYRGSYRRWREGRIAPHVVFEVLSPGNRPRQMREKHRFYERFGVQEYYVFDPDTDELTGYQRAGDLLSPIPAMDGWVSPLLGIRFDCSGPKLVIRYPDGKPFQKFEELGKRAEDLAKEILTTAEERDAIAADRDAIAAERDRARERAERLAARLRELGVELPE